MSNQQSGQAKPSDEELKLRRIKYQLIMAKRLQRAVLPKKFKDIQWEAHRSMSNEEVTTLARQDVHEYVAYLRGLAFTIEANRTYTTRDDMATIEEVRDYVKGGTTWDIYELERKFFNLRRYGLIEPKGCGSNERMRGAIGEIIHLANGSVAKVVACRRVEGGVIERTIRTIFPAWDDKQNASRESEPKEKAVHTVSDETLTLQKQSEGTSVMQASPQQDPPQQATAEQVPPQHDVSGPPAKADSNDSTSPLNAANEPVLQIGTYDTRFDHAKLVELFQGLQLAAYDYDEELAGAEGRAIYMAQCRAQRSTLVSQGTVPMLAGSQSILQSTAIDTSTWKSQRSESELHAIKTKADQAMERGVQIVTFLRDTFGLPSDAAGTGPVGART